MAYAGDWFTGNLMVEARGQPPDAPRPRSSVARANRDVPARHGKQG